MGRPTMPARGSASRTADVPEAICGNGVVEAGEGCEPPCSEEPPCATGEISGVTCQCVPKEPCD